MCDCQTAVLYYSIIIIISSFHYSPFITLSFPHIFSYLISLPFVIILCDFTATKLLSIVFCWEYDVLVFRN